MHPSQILEQADRCVKCGLCLPHCPSYREQRVESAAPRGRVALIQGLVSGALTETPRLYAALEQCWHCGACEANCPSGVPITALVDAARTLHMQRLSRPQRWWRQQVLHQLTQLDPWLPWLRLYQRYAPRALLCQSGLLNHLGLARLEHLLPETELPATISSYYPARHLERGVLNLFPGCVGRIFDSRAFSAAAHIFTELGFAVQLPQAHLCCGALHRHYGFPQLAAVRQSQCQSYLTAQTAPVLTFASACLAELQRTPATAMLVVDATRFLTELAWPETLQLRPLNQLILVHIPCTQRYILRDTMTAPTLLVRIPQLRLLILPATLGCCGGMSSLANGLNPALLTAIENAQPARLVTTNTGCALRLAAGIRAAGLTIEVVHPLELIASQWPAS